MAIQWSLVLFTVIAGAGMWLFASVGLAEFKVVNKKTAFTCAVVAVVLMGIGGICSVTHLSHPERVLGALGHPAPGIFLEALLLMGTALVAIIYAVLVRREAGEGARKALGVIGFVLAVVFSFACGMSYMMPSHPAWDTITLPLAYLGTAAVSGTALYLMICAAKHESEEVVGFAAKLTLAASVVAMVVLIAYAVASGYQSMFAWVAIVAVGGIAPLVCAVVAMKKPANALTLSVVAFVGAVVGSLALRAVMWLAGEALMSIFGVAI